MLRGIAALGSLFCFGLMLFGLLTWQEGPPVRVLSILVNRGGPWLVIAAAPLAILELGLLFETFTVFTIGREGVLRRPLLGSSKFVRWTEVRRVSINQATGSLKVASAAYEMTLASWLSGKDVLAELLAERLPPDVFEGKRDAIVSALRQ